MLRLKNEAEFLAVKTRMKHGSVAQLAGKIGKNKFNAKKAEVDGVEFDSKKEAERYSMLRLEEKAGFLERIKVHCPLRIEIKGELVTTLEVDFMYWRRHADGTVLAVWEDAKGYKKGPAYDLFKLKQKLARVVAGIVVDEV
jgi:hypothetical protein